MRAKDSEKFRLSNDEVHIWTVHPSVQPKAIDAHCTLSENEKERASKFRFERDRNTYITGRVVLRFLLSEYLGLNPERIVFEYNEQGKPLIPNSSLQFNLSNTEQSIAIGISKKDPIGIDLEYNKRSIEVPQIASNFFSKNEVDKLLALPESKQLSTFYNCWTRKEAYIKAKGGGLSIPLDQFEMAFLPDEKPEILEIDWERDSTTKWSMHSFSMGKDYTGAAIVEKSACDFKQHVFEDAWLETRVNLTNTG